MSTTHQRSNLRFYDHRPATFDLLQLPILRALVGRKHARTWLQIPLFVLALVMIWDGFTGSQLAPRNTATVLTWVHYRGLVVLALLIAGNLFCMACPFMLPRNLARKFVRPVRAWPKRLRTKWVAAFLLGSFFFVYEAFDLWATPWWTAWLIVGYFVAAILIDSLFSGASFCKYVCPIGQFNMSGSLVSPLEIRTRSAQVCADCRTKDCITGRGELRGCELGLFVPRKGGNMDCTFCLDCVQACPHNNIGLMTRLPAAELWNDPPRSGIGRFTARPDLAALMLIWVFGALINAFGMVSPVYTLLAWMQQQLNLSSESAALGVLFVVALVIEPLVLLGIAAWWTRRVVGRNEALVLIAVRYAYALVPFGFGMWLAHYMVHFLAGFWTFVPVAQYVLNDIGFTLFGPPRWELGPLLPGSWLTASSWGMIGLGAFGSLLSAWKIAQRDAPQQARAAVLPWVLLIIGLAALALWVMAQPMEMRGMIIGS